MNVSIFIGEDKLDLFNDETIEITSSVTNANDITKNTIDFSKNFTVPASEINNKVFKHWYNSDIDNGFDARTKVDGRIEINGVVFKYGKFSLLGAKLKQNKASSYSLVFYGNAISLVDLLGSDELSSLDLSVFDHPYNDLNVAIGLGNVGLFNRNIRYPLMAKKRYYYNSSPTDDGVESNLISNISYASWANGVNWKDLRASLRLIRIIEAIEIKYGFTFSRDFFGRVEFNELYLWLDNEKQKDISEDVFVDFTNIGNIPNNAWDIDIANNTIAKVIDISFEDKIQIEIFPTTSASYKLIVLRDGNVIYMGAKRGYAHWEINDYYDSSFNKSNQKFSFKISSNSSGFKFTSRLLTGYKFFGKWYYFSASFPSQTISVNYEIKNQITKIKIIDFLKGLFQMFKLVIIQDKVTDPIYINTLKDYYSTANLFDITEYTSSNSMDIERGKILNEIMYKYEDPQTILAKEFKENTGLGYGDNELILKEDILDPNSKKIDGEKEEIKLPFEQVVYERLTDGNTDVQSNIQYAAIIDDKIEPVNIKPHIHYIIDNDIVPNYMKFRKDDGSTLLYQGMVSTPSHTNDFSDTPSHSLVFDREFSTFTGVAIENTLYTNYHNDYIESIFQAKRRNIKVEAKLPLRIILNLKIKDVLKIKENYYRINTWTYNLLTGIAKFDLINSFDNTINGFNADRTVINTNGAEKIESIYVTNFTNLIFDYTADWINSATYLGNNVYFGIDANDTGLFRTEIVTLINSDTLAEIEITINQTPNIIKADNNLITADNNLITADNG